MKILVTGGTGFIGSNLVRALVDKGHEIVVVGVQTESSIPGISKFLNLHFRGIRWHQIKNIDVAFHLAANNDTQNLDGDEMIEANYSSPVHLFEQLRTSGCKKIVYASSTAVYGNASPPYREKTTEIAPLTVYGESKAMFDKYAAQFSELYGMSVIGLRYCNVYGPREDHKGKRKSMIGQLISQMMDGHRPKLFKSGEQKRDWLYVKDAVDANLKAMETNVSGIFNCASGIATSFNDLISIINKNLGTNLEPEYVDNPIKDTYQNHTECDISMMKNTLGFSPQFDVAKGIDDYIEFIKSR